MKKITIQFFTLKKSLVLLIGCILFACCETQAQVGLENVIVEKYYVSNAADSAGSIGLLPVGSVTYRVFLDLLPGYSFQALYGINSPLHELRIATTTSFFNNEDRGSTTPTYSKTNASHNTVMLDSWLSVGAACSGNFGIMKSEDNGIVNVVNTNGILQNNDPSAGIPLTVQDGLIAGSPEAVSFVGLSSSDLEVFNATSQYGNLFSTINGSVASLNGSTGPTSSNRILVGQFTTNGDFSFELNVQLRAPNNSIQNLVARNPVGNEIQLNSLIYPYNTPPTVNITAPANNANFFTGNIVSISAAAADSDGTVSSVEFFVNNVSIGTDNTSPYQVNWTSMLGTAVLTAVVTDNHGAQTTSTPDTIHVITNLPPTVSITSPSNNSNFFTGDTVVINANASDTDGTVTNVQFYIDGNPAGSDSIAPYSLHYISTAGNHTLTAIATDNYGFQTTSSPITIHVVNNMPPTVTLTAPLNNANYITGNTVTIDALASDADGSIVSVVFYVNNVLMGSVTSQPYEFNWASVAGTASISAVATDNHGATTTSNIVSINVQNSNAQSPFTPGNIVVYRVGDGNSILVNTGNPVFLDEYTTTGSLVQSIPMPTTSLGDNHAIVASGTASTEGFMTTAADGHSLFLTGYDGVSSSSLPGSTSRLKNRVVAKVDPLGNINTTTALVDYADGGNPRSVVSSNGTDIWVVGSNGGIRYTTVGSISSSLVLSAATNLRQINIFNNQLYTSTNAVSTVRIGTVGTGTPTSSGQPITSLPGLPTNTGSPVGFYFADLNNTIGGHDVLYIADENGFIMKYSLVNNTWVSNGSIPASTPRGLTGEVVGDSVNLFITRGVGSSSGGGNIYSLTDNSGYNATITGTINTIATAQNETTFRGVAFVPAPCYPVTVAVQPVSPPPLCSGVDTTTMTVQVSGSGPFTYQWQENSADISDSGVYSGTNSPTLTITHPTTLLNGNTYRCIITNCYASNTVFTDNNATLTVNPLPVVTVTASGPTVFCDIDSVTLNATNNLSSYVWSNNSTTQSITVRTSGSYIVTVIDSLGCRSVSTPVNVMINASPVVNVTPLGPTTFCDENSVVISATAGMTSYLWSNGDTTPSTTVTTSGNYFVTVTNANGCTSQSSSIIVTVHPLPSAVITPSGPTTFCPGGSVQLNAATGSGLSYVWSNGSVNSSITVSAMGVFTVQVTDSFGCSATTSSPLSVTIHTLPSDINRDGITDNNDFLLFVAQFDETCSGCPADINGDGVIDTHDFLILLAEFNETCQ